MLIFRVAIANDITATTTTTRAASALKSSTLPASVGAHRGGMVSYSIDLALILAMH